MPLVLDGDTGIVGVLLTDANGNVTFDTNTLYVDAPNNRVGIGTTVPDGKLTVALENSNTPAFRLSSPTSGTDFAISSYNDANGTYVSIGVNHLFDVSGNDAVMDTNDKSAAIVLDGRNNGRIQFLTNNSGIATPRMTILKDGKVGINNTTPPVKLSVGKTITAYEDSIAITGINSNADIMAGIGFDQSIDTLIIRNDQSFATGGIAFRPANGTTTKMFIRQDGYVSIGGTHAPVETLDLRFSGRHGIICGSTSGSGSYIVLDGAGNGDAAGADYAYIEHTSSGNLNFNVGNGSNSTNTKMLIEPGGNVGVGLGDPAYKLDIGGIGATQLRLKSSGDTGYTQGAMIIESSASSSNPGNRGQGVYYYNVPNLRTWYTGTLYNNGNKFGFGYKQASGLQVSAADNANAIMILDGDNSLLELKKTNGTLSGGASRSGATIKLHHEAQWESGYGNNPSASTNDYLGGIEFSTGDNSIGEGVRAAIRATVDSYYNQNSIVFETVSGATAADPIERMRVLHNGNVGIGTTDPKSTLDTGYTRIYNSGAASSPSAGKGLEVHYVTSGRTQGEGAYLISYDRDNSAYKQFVVDANNIELSTGGNNRLSILSGGNVGIGTSNPGAKLTLYGGSTTTQTFQSSWSSGTGRIAFTGGTSSSDGSNASSTAAKIESLATAPGGAATGDLKLIVNSGDSFVTGIEIVPDGAVRLALQGTHTTIGSYDDPRAPYGWNNITTNNHADVLWGLNTRLIGSGTGHDFEVVSSHGSINHCGIMFTGNGNPESPNGILFYTRSGSSTAGTVYNSSSQKFTMNSGGSFLAEEGNSGAVIRLDNIGNSGTSNHYIELSSNLPGYANGKYNCLKTNFNDLHFVAGNVYTGYISYNGGFTDISDQSLKENVVTIDGALSKVEQLQGRYFTWISEDQSDDRQIGFIAQEVEAVIPELVTTSDTGIKGMSYGKTTALLVEAIKEQQATIQALQDRLDAAGL